MKREQATALVRRIRAHQNITILRKKTTEGDSRLIQALKDAGATNDEIQRIRWDWQN